MIILRHGTVSWAGDAEPPFPGKVHLILEDTERDEESCEAACKIAGPTDFGWVCDFVDAPVTCKRCLRVHPEKVEKLQKDMAERAAGEW